MARHTANRRRFLTQVGDPSDPDGLFACMQHYLEYLGVKGHTPMGIYNVERYIRAFIRWCEPRALARPQQISKTDIESYERYLFHRRKEDGEPLSIFSRRSALVPLRGFFRWLARENLVLRDPAASIELPRATHVLPNQVLTATEAERVLRQPDTHRPGGMRDRAMMEVLYSTGMRRMEIANLHVPDIDEERGLIFVSQGKWRKDRWIPVSDRALKWVQRYLEEVRPMTVMPPDDGTLFLTRNDVPFNESWLSTTISNYIRKARLGKHGGCHLFRHTMATLMLENGADIRFIQAMLGHADLKSTQIYAHVSVGQLKAIHSATHPGCRLSDSQRRPALLSAYRYHGQALKQYLRALADELPETATMQDVLYRLLPHY
jgi:integrase/recombinase XerD